MKRVSELTSYHSTDPIKSDGVKTFYMGMEFNDIESDMFLHPVYYPLSLFRDASGEEDENHLFPLQINKITHVIPWSPVLTQYDQFSEVDLYLIQSMRKKYHLAVSKQCRISLHRLIYSFSSFV